MATSIKVGLVDDDESSARTSLARLIRMPDLDGFDLQETLATTLPYLSVVFITGHGDIPIGRALALSTRDGSEI